MKHEFRWFAKDKTCYVWLNFKIDLQIFSLQNSSTKIFKVGCFIHTYMKKLFSGDSSGDVFCLSFTEQLR